jgi:hypothetical protein
MIGGCDFCVILEDLEGIDSLDGGQEKCRLWQVSLFKVFPTKSYGGRGLFMRPLSSPPIRRHF